MAVGPMQGDMERLDQKQHAPHQPTKYRLMLHYYDHSIINYELSRYPGSQELKVVTF
jgi:hypothetical protein